MYVVACTRTRGRQLRLLLKVSKMDEQRVFHVSFCKGPAEEARQSGDAQSCAQQRMEHTEVRSGLRAHASSRGA